MTLKKHKTLNQRATPSLRVNLWILILSLFSVPVQSRVELGFCDLWVTACLFSMVSLCNPKYHNHGPKKVQPLNSNVSTVFRRKDIFRALLSTISV